MGNHQKAFILLCGLAKSSIFLHSDKKKKQQREQHTLEKTWGSHSAVSLITTIGTTSYLITLQAFYMLGAIAFVLLSTFILKSMFSIKSMDKHIIDILVDIEKNDIEKARNDLAKIVSRDTKTLSEEKILSACIECTSESFVDGILSPLFYYGILNIPGATIFRVVNTLDSMIGYKDKYYKDIGWMSAKMDTIMNLIPARISIVFLVTSSLILNLDWKNAISTCKRYGRSTEKLECRNTHVGYCRGIKDSTGKGKSLQARRHVRTDNHSKMQNNIENNKDCYFHVYN